MAHHWKAIVFVTSASLVAPLVLFLFHSRLSLVWNAVLVTLSFFLLVTYTHPFFTDPLRHLPHPPSTRFVLGNGLMAFATPPGEIFEKWSRAIANDGLIYARGFFHNKQYLVITSPDAAREVLLERPYDFEKPARAREFLAQILGGGLIVVEGHEHKIQRKVVAPAFHTQHIHELIPIFWAKSQELTTSLATSLEERSSSGVRSGIVEINAISSRVTLDIIGLAGLGRDFRTLNNSDDELAKAYEQITDPSGVKYWAANMLLSPWLVQKLPWSENARFKSVRATLRRTVFNLLNEKRASLTESDEQQKDILTILLRAKTPLTDDQLIDQLLTFLAAGHETTSSALTWAMYLLAEHMDVQERLRADVRDATAKISPDGEAVDIKNIDSLPFMQAVCNETLRLFPTVPNTARRTARQTSILGYPVPPNVDVMISMWALNRLPSLWGSDADQFRPDRWLDGEDANTGGAKSPYAFLTFLHGPRSCIGQGFARTELKYLLASLLIHFKWEMADRNEEIVRAGAITIKPRHGLRIRLIEL